MKSPSSLSSFFRAGDGFAPWPRGDYALRPRRFELGPQLFALAADRVPFAAQRLHDDRLEQRFDIGPAGVVRADLGAFAGSRMRSKSVPKIDGSTLLQSSALTKTSVSISSGVSVKDFGVGEQAAVELEDFVGAERRRRWPSLRRVVPSSCESSAGVDGRACSAASRILREDFVRQQADVLGEHAEHELHQEVGGVVGGDAALAHAVGEFAEELGGLLGDGFGGLAGRSDSGSVKTLRRMSRLAGSARPARSNS